jgi:hypothetical protein
MATLSRITYDIDAELEANPPQPGDFLSSSRSRYRIVDARPVESRVWPHRWALRCERLGPHGGKVPDTDWRIRWYGRHRRPGDA